MYKNQLQELAQRSCFNLPSYTCIREGPDHAPRFKATVNFNGEIYESPNYCTTLRQAEHSAAEVALNALASRGPSNSLAARILDETGVYKNLLQEVSQRVGSSLPIYTTFRSGLGHLPVFTCIVELAGCIFTGEPAKNKKQAEKNAAMAAWSSLKLLVQQSESSSSSQKFSTDEQEHVTVARALQKFRLKVRMSNTPFPIRFPAPKPKPPASQPPQSTTSKILPLICPKSNPRNRQSLISPLKDTPNSQKTPQNMPITSLVNDTNLYQTLMSTTELSLQSAETPKIRPPKFPAVGAAPYIPVRQLRAHCGVAPPVTIRNSMPVFSPPPLPPPSHSAQISKPLPFTGVAPPVHIRQAIPVFSAPETSKALAEERVCASPAVPAPEALKSTPNPTVSIRQPAPIFPAVESSKAPLTQPITSSLLAEESGCHAQEASSPEAPLNPSVISPMANEEKGSRTSLELLVREDMKELQV